MKDHPYSEVIKAHKKAVAAWPQWMRDCYQQNYSTIKTMDIKKIRDHLESLPPWPWKKQQKDEYIDWSIKALDDCCRQVELFQEMAEAALRRGMDLKVECELLRAGNEVLRAEVIEFQKGIDALDRFQNGL